jgi:hypothetical protein
MNCGAAGWISDERLPDLRRLLRQLSRRFPSGRAGRRRLCLGFGCAAADDAAGDAQASSAWPAQMRRRRAASRSPAGWAKAVTCARSTTARPSPCREFDTSHEACARARQRHGLPPLTDGLIPVSGRVSLWISSGQAGQFVEFRALRGRRLKNGQFHAGVTASRIRNAGQAGSLKHIMRGDLLEPVPGGSNKPNHTVAAECRKICRFPRATLYERKSPCLKPIAPTLQSVQPSVSPRCPCPSNRPPSWSPC